MAEAEDVITDVARHATIYAQGLWRRHRTARGKGERRAPPGLADFARRLDLLVTAVFGVSYPIRVAQPPAPPSLLSRFFGDRGTPPLQQAVPATDGTGIWLPSSPGEADPVVALDRYRAVALQQAMRARRGSAAAIDPAWEAPLHETFLLLEAHAADEAIARMLPGMAPAIDRLRRHALASRPDLDRFAPERRGFELFVRKLLAASCGVQPADLPASDTPADSLSLAPVLLADLVGPAPHPPHRSGRIRPAHGLLLRDWWTGDLRACADQRGLGVAGGGGGRRDADDGKPAPRSARLSRTPRVRRAEPDEDEGRQGAFMIQTAQPHEHAEDPGGMQRPPDQDEETPAEELAESLADLPEARLVSTPGRTAEVLLSDDAPPAIDRTTNASTASASASVLERLAYPEWDYRVPGYRHPGATVRLLPPALGPQQWVDATLARHRGLRDEIRRRFEMLRAEPTRLRRQLDGDEIDLEAYVEGQADYRAGLALSQAIYQTRRRARRSMAIMLLVDVSGSTDAWIGGQRRVIDVEREALLLVCLALQSLGEPYSVVSFSGEGAESVDLRALKGFEEPYGNPIARRIAALEPEYFTRTGAALRHATAMLMEQPAAHRLLLLLSDGKPNDVDVYEGRYGLEDTRQAVAEARLQGVFPFCLTVDRQAAEYLPSIFGPRQYGLLPRPELLPAVLLEWMRRLLST
jgi:nitric oxide reductase NorD protein